MRHKLFQLLEKIQESRGFLPPEELTRLSEKTLIPLSTIHSVATFYPHFRFKKPVAGPPAHCADISCHLRRGREKNGQLPPGQEVSCLGQCEKAPVSLSGLETPETESVFSIEHLDPYAGGREPYAIAGGLRKEHGSADIIQILKDSGIRGMGGAGFPVGLKWDLVRQTKPEAALPGDPEPRVKKYVICNADESEPGTFKDRLILERACHLVLEGMLIAMKVVGTRSGILFIRHEYVDARSIAAREIDRIKAPIRIFTSPGGYICGEETALLEAIENHRAEPRHKPPFPGVHGLFQKPTLINNVETFAWIPALIHHGAAWWKSFGENGAVGRKLFALSGDVRRPGVYETPLGITVSDLVNRHGQGLPEGKSLKAFMPGGASSGFLPAAKAGIPLDFRPLAEAGSMLGSGAVVAVASDTCMLDLALNTTRFFSRESCGKCVPCRVGTAKILAILEKTRMGNGSEKDVALIEELSETMQLTSICGLGQIAAMPAVSALKYFREEFSAHFGNKGCPAGICQKRNGQKAPQKNVQDEQGG